MSTGGTIALVVGAAAVIGGGAYLLTRQPVSKSTTTLRPVPAGRAAGVGTAAAALGSGLGGLLTTLFGSSKNSPTTAILQGQSQPADNAATQSWNNTGTSTFDELAQGDAAMGVEGPY